MISGTTILSEHADFFQHREHLGVIINTDGVPLFKSSKSSIWPVYLEIANLPPSLRFRHDNTIICGLYVGQGKPKLTVLMKPIMESINYMNAVGFAFMSPEGVKTVRIKLLFGIFDLIAKAPMLNMNQFNGAYGCPTCLHPGMSSSPGARVYLPGTIYPIRSLLDIRNAIAESKEQGNTIRGIKGVSPIAGYLHLVNGIPIDYMHCVAEGVVKYLLVAWTDSKRHKEHFSIRKHLQDIDQCLLNQLPPHEFTRAPRSIVFHLSYWKANEFRNWLLFYSLPLLLHCLPPLYFHHFALLVCAMHLLLKRKLSQVECSLAEEMLKEFYDLATSCTMNAHSLIHIAHYVRQGEHSGANLLFPLRVIMAISLKWLTQQERFVNRYHIP